MVPDHQHRFEAELWRSGDGKAAWTFLTVPLETSQQIRFMAGQTNSFGSIPVRARIGDKSWKTSLFPDKASGCYFLPVKAEVRRAQAISAGDWVSAELVFG